MAKLVITSRSLFAMRQMIKTIRSKFPDARIFRTGFGGIITIEADRDPLGFAREVNTECFTDIGRAVPVLAEIESVAGKIKEATIKVGAEHIHREEKFCFRLYKRGKHGLERPTPELEREIGEAILKALERKYGGRPNVDLKNPDVKVIAEVFGPKACVGILRREWAPS